MTGSTGQTENYITRVPLRGVSGNAVQYSVDVRVTFGGDACGRYVHRVGRTARLGKVGEAVLFLLPCETGYLSRLEAAGASLQRTSVLPALDLLPSTSSDQQVSSWTPLQCRHKHSCPAALLELVNHCEGAHKA